MVRKDMIMFNVMEDMALDKAESWSMFHIADC